MVNVKRKRDLTDEEIDRICEAHDKCERCPFFMVERASGQMCLKNWSLGLIAVPEINPDGPVAYQWLYSQFGNRTLHGVCFAESEEEARVEIMAYILDQFSDAMREKPTFTYPILQVWKAEDDDDFHDAHPKCFVTNY